MAGFVKVAKKSDIPTDTGYMVEANGKEIALFQKDGKVYGIYNICPHAGGPMAEGSLHEGKAMCPWHGWEFHLETGKCDFNDSIEIPVFEIKEEGEDIYVKA